MGVAVRVDEQDSSDGLGVIITGTIGFAVGLVIGIVSGGLLGDVDADRVKRAVRRFRPEDQEPDEDSERVEYDLLRALRGTPTTRQLELSVQTLGGGLVEIVGTAPDEATRELIGEIARNVEGVGVVVNRVLIEGTDTGGQSVMGDR